MREKNTVQISLDIAWNLKDPYWYHEILGKNIAASFVCSFSSFLAYDGDYTKDVKEDAARHSFSRSGTNGIYNINSIAFCFQSALQACSATVGLVFLQQ